MVKNYRPVSHLVELGLLVERAVCHQILNHFIKNDLLHGNHHGSVPNHSTATALIQIYDLALRAADDKKMSALLLLDQTAAYDLLDHNILLKKLKQYAFDEKSIKWVNSYLCDRSQSVLIESKLSPSVKIGEFGAPQGSLLGGLLFIINENDFPSCRLEGESILYVDDDSDIVHDNDPDVLLEKIQLEANASCSWLKDNRMCVAGEKSKLLIICTDELRRARLGPDRRSINVDEKVVEETTSEKTLGIIFSNNLLWKEYLDGLMSSLSQRLGILKRLSKFCSRSKLSMLSEGIFYSKLRYCLPLVTTTWGLDEFKDSNCRFPNFTLEDNRKLQVLQNQVCRIILGKQSIFEKQLLPTSDLLLQCNQLSIHQLGAFTTVMMAKKILISGKPIYLRSRLKKQISGRTRESKALMSINARLNTTRSSFVYRSIKLLNRLPQELRDELDLEKFKQGLKTWIKCSIDVKPQ